MKLEKYLSEEEEEDVPDRYFRFSPQQIKNLKIYGVVGMEDSQRYISLKKGITKLYLNKHLNPDEAGSVKDFCLDVLDGNTAKFKSLMA